MARYKLSDGLDGGKICILLLSPLAKYVAFVVKIG